MADQQNQTSSSSHWTLPQVGTMATVCLFLGVLVGYLVHGSAATPVSAEVRVKPAANSAAPETQPQRMPTLEQMKHMADKQAEPLLEQLKGQPNDPALLVKIGDVYRSAHQFGEAASYYEHSLRSDPQDLGVRADMANCLFYSGDVDKSIATLEGSLKYDPKHPGTLYNLGVIKWKGKGDAKGAIAAWETLLRLNPDVANRDAILKLIAQAKQDEPAR